MRAAALSPNLKIFQSSLYTLRLLVGLYKGKCQNNVGYYFDHMLSCVCQ